MFYMSAGVYALGPRYAHLATNRPFLLTVSLVAIWIALGTNLVGMRVGKWTENAGAASSWVLGALLVVIACVLYGRRGSATPLDFAPVWNWDTISFWSTIAYAMTGLEMVALVGGEIRDPERTLPRAGWIASGFTTLFYVSATVAMLVILRPEKISELNGLGEVGAYAASALRTGWLGPLIAALVMASAVGQFGGMGTSVSRLPFAVGVDRLLPAAFGKVHPRWRTPHVSILVLGVLASFLLIVIQLGDTMRAAYQALVSLMVITGFFPYVYMFGSGWKAGRRWSAIAGWGVTLIAIGCSVIPTAEVTNVWLFETKLAVGTAGVIATAWWLYRRAGTAGAPPNCG
jgi:amino acid transporter